MIHPARYLPQHGAKPRIVGGINKGKDIGCRFNNIRGYISRHHRTNCGLFHYRIVEKAEKIIWLAWIFVACQISRDYDVWALVTIRRETGWELRPLARWSTAAGSAFATF